VTAVPRDRAALWQPIFGSLQRLAAADATVLRFGAATHRYRRGVPISESRLAEIEAAGQVRLPEDYRDFLLEFGDGGAGPYYGLVALDQPAQLAQLAGACQLGEHVAAAPATPWCGVVTLGHLGCGYLVYLVLSGPRRGQVWLDASAAGVMTCIAPHFIAYYSDWLEAREHAEWPPAHVAPGVCALAQGLSGYLAVMEKRWQRPAGTLDDQQLRDALSALGPGSICVIAEASRSLLLPRDAPVDPCVACEQLLLALAGQGLSRHAVAPGRAIGTTLPAGEHLKYP
jgi:hypothetical protein